jgi:alkylhydroperoxidase/carboxymuconolactone decarboxylase family protein YurZ
MPTTEDLKSAVQQLRVVYGKAKADGSLVTFLEGAFKGLFSLSHYQTDADSPIDAYLAAFRQGFFAGPVSGRLMSDDDRERVVVALLASQGSQGNLALHIYLALMEGVEPHEIAEILFLTGLYAGTNRLTASLKAANVVFTKLVEVTQPPQPSPAPPPPATPPAPPRTVGELAAAIMTEFPSP